MKTRRFFFLLAAFAWIGSAEAQPLRPGVDCDCQALGTYSVPAAFRVPALGDPTSVTSGTSPGGRYSYEVAFTPLSVGVRVVISIYKTGELDPNKRLKATAEASVTSAAWGFSPDEDRFVLHGLAAADSKHWVWIYDLTQPRVANESRVIEGLWTQHASLGFSPSGSHFAYAALDGDGNLFLKVIDSRDVRRHHTVTSLTLSPVSAADAGLAAWGFSPPNEFAVNAGSADAAFVYAWMGLDNQADYRLLNLEQMDIVDTGGAAAGTWWGFSPCGDLFALLDGNTKVLRLIQTVDGVELDGTGYAGVAMALRPRAEANWHYLGDEPVTSNTAYPPCAGPLDSDEDGIPDVDDNCPYTPNAGQEDADQNGVGDACEEDRDGDGVADVTDNCPDTPNAGQEDDDGDGIGDACEVIEPPTWPEGSTLTASAVTDTSLTLSWTPAMDDQGVTGYQIYQGGALLDSVAGEVLETEVSGLDAAAFYLFRVEAGDADGAWTVDGPSVFVFTPDTTPPGWPEGSALDVLDVQGTRLTLRWPAAEDNDQVAGYRLWHRRSGNEPVSIVTVAAEVLSYTVTCLIPGRAYAFELEARDPAGNWTSERLSATARTLTVPDPCGLPLERVSLATLGEEMQFAEAPGSVGGSAISADGRFVAFESAAANLVSADENEVSDVFVRDRETERTARASVSTGGIVEGNRGGLYGVREDRVGLSADGRYVVFGSFATNLVPTDTNGDPDIFVHDRVNLQTERVSVSSAGEEGDYDQAFAAYSPAISADGKVVAFSSLYDTLVASDGNGVGDIFVHDRTTRRTTRVNLSSEGDEANDWSGLPVLSGDGRFVAFQSMASNLVPGDDNVFCSVGQDGKLYCVPCYDIFVRDRVEGTTERISVSSAGEQADGPSWSPGISADGRFVVFRSAADNLVPNDSNQCVDIFVHDRVKGTTRRVSVASGGQQANGHCQEPVISGDGRFVAFASAADNLVPDDTNGVSDVFLHDRFTGQIVRVSVCGCGDEANGVCSEPALSATGQHVAFKSAAGNLLADLADANGSHDIFVYTVQRTDQDSDGIVDADESGPQGTDPAYDGNGDGVADAEQSHVASFHTAQGEGYVTLAAPEGVGLHNVRVTENPSPGDAPPGIEFPFGIWEFELEPVPLDGAVRVTLFGPPEVELATYFKYGPTPSASEAHWYEFSFDGTTGAELSPGRVILHFIDGQRGDDDLVVNGRIREPGAPAAFALSPPGAVRAVWGDSDCLRLLWSVQPGRTYRVQGRDDLIDGSWFEVSDDLTPEGALLSWEDCGAGERRYRFYRVLRVQ